MTASLALAASPIRRGGAWRLVVGACVALAVLLTAAAALAAPTFPKLTGRVVDNAQLLSPATEQQLTDELAGLEQQTGRQVVVVTLPDLQGYEIEEYGYQLGRAWAIGQKGEDNGVLFIVAPSDRKVRIEVGYGLEPVLTDALSSVILQRAVLPQFRDGNFERGVVDGTNEIVKQLALPEDEAKANVAKAAEQPKREHSPPIPVFVIVLIVFFVLARVLGGGRRGRRGGGMAWWLLPIILDSGRHRGGGGWGGGGGFGGGGFGGGGGSFGGGGSSGSW